MGELINLKRARKARKRGQDRAEAAANRLRHGRTKIQRAAETSNAMDAQRRHEGHKRPTDGAHERTGKSSEEAQSGGERPWHKPGA